MAIRNHFMPAGVSITALAMLVAIGIAAIPASSAQQIYRWVDKDGRVTYSQNPPPTGAAKSVEQRRITTSVVEGSDLPYAVQVAMKNFPVTLHTSSDCADPCKDGRDMLTKRGIPFKEVVVGNEQSIEALRKISGGTRVPVLQVGRQTLSGFEPGAWKNALDDAGYPASIATTTRKPGPSSVQRNLPEVKLYVTPDCGQSCQGAKDLLAARKIPYREVLVQGDESLAELKKIAGSADVVPVLLVGGTSIKGFSSDSYNTELDNAGYQPPSTAKK
jgi:glutaredoxin